MLFSFRKDRSLINVLADLELILSEAVDKLDIDPSTLQSISVVDSTRKYENWNKVDTANVTSYLKFYRYEIPISIQSKVALPWRDYDTTKDISIKVYLDGKLLTPTTDYVIRADVDGNNNVSGYIIDLGPYLMLKGATYTSGDMTVIRTTTNLPSNVAALDLGITRYDRIITNAQTNFNFPWGTIGDSDLYYEVYVNGELWREDVMADSNTKTFKAYSSYIYFNTPITGNLTIIRYHKN